MKRGILTTLILSTSLAAMGTFSAVRVEAVNQDAVKKTMQEVETADQNQSNPAGVLIMATIALTTCAAMGGAIQHFIARRNQSSPPPEPKIAAKIELKVSEAGSPILAQVNEAPAAIVTATSATDAYVERAYEHLEQGNVNQAIAEFATALERHPDNAHLYTERAKFRRKKLNDLQGAIDDYSQAIQLHPQNAMFYMLRSQVYQALGDARRAIEDHNTALYLAPEGTLYHIGR